MTARQRLILLLKADGCTRYEIAATLNYSPSTIRREIADVLRELGARNCAHAFAIAYRKGLVK